MKRIEPKRGWVEIDDEGQIVMGNVGLKVYRYKKDLLAEGFSKDEVAYVLLTPLRVPMKVQSLITHTNEIHMSKLQGLG